MANQTDAFILVDEQLTADFIAEGMGEAAAATAITVLANLVPFAG